MADELPATKKGAVPGTGGGAVPPRVPDHELTRCIGSGSYGEVWLARTLTGSYRAVKVVFRKSFRDTGPFEREFTGIQKFEPISRSHDGFVDILQVGRNDADGCFYYVMEVADDVTRGQQIDPSHYAPRTLATEISSRGKLPLAECLQLGLSLSDALDHLHKHNLVHRDIKPTNIIFVNGTPRLADIGLVTEAGQRSFVGTEGYIPPEGPGTTAADLFALGRVLYEAATGKDRLRFPELASSAAEGQDLAGWRSLNEVILKACENDPRQRYQTAYELHSDLQLLQQGKPFPAAPAKKRGRVLALAAAAVVLLLVVSVAVIRFGNQPLPASLPANVAALPAADVLKIAYGAKPPAPRTRFDLPRIQLSILARRAGEPQFAPLRDGDTLISEKDDYQIVAQTFSPGHLYVFQVDAAGKKEWLFPRNDSSRVSSGANPLPAGQMVRIPSGASQTALYLDDVTGVEHIYAVFSAAQWPELERALAQPGRAGAVSVLQPNALQLRGVAGARETSGAEPLEATGSVLVIERWFHHSASRQP
jgi:hypothetical protein